MARLSYGVSVKTQRAEIEPWNQSVHEKAVAFDEPQIWLLLTPLEVKALIEDIVPTRVKKCCRSLDREVLVEPDDQSRVVSVPGSAHGDLPRRPVR